MLRAKRFYKVLAIETSCDDTAVCLIDRLQVPRLIDHRKRTLNSAQAGGIIPSDAMSHHLSSVGPLVQGILEDHGRPKIDLVCATRGPGMYSSLAAGLQVGKGLAIAWDAPFVGVHHMLGHLLTPRFFSDQVQFPFLSLLISGGHTQLVLSKSVSQHRIVAETIDIAAGNALDKTARHLGLHGVMLGKEMDLLCTSGPAAPLEFNVPLALEKPNNGDVHRAAYSFAHFSSLVPRIAKGLGLDPLESQSIEVKRAFGLKFQNAIFEHIMRKTKLAIKKLVDEGELQQNQTVDFVLSGGVAGNSLMRQRLMHMQSELSLNFHLTPLEWCTDNALMIGWAGIEMYEAGLGLGVDGSPIAKWPLHELDAHPDNTPR